MKKNFLPLALLLGTFAAPAAFALPISEVAELQFHKVDQLAATHKVDAGFVEHLKSVRLKKEANGANYIVTFAQESDSPQSAPTVSVTANANGKPLSYVVGSGTPARQLADWGGKAPLDLLEKAVEYVVDTTANPILVPFREGFVSASISPATDASGLHGVVEVLAGAQDGTLEIIVDLNGKILSASVKK